MRELLTSDQQGILARLVDTWRQLPKDQRTSFHVLTWDGEDDRPVVTLDGTSYQQRIFEGDLEEMARAGLLQLELGRYGPAGFRLTNDAFHYVTEVSERAGSIARDVEGGIRRLVESDTFTTRYPSVRLQLGLAAAAFASPDAELQRGLLAALVTYWEAATGVIQRQVHGTHGEEPPLTVADARRVVFHTFLVIYEFERTLERVRIDTPA